MNLDLFLCVLLLPTCRDASWSFVTSMLTELRMHALWSFETLQCEICVSITGAFVAGASE